MSFNGSGTFSLVAGNPVVTGTTISSTWANNTLNDIATGLSTTITKDGQTTPTANIPMGGYKVTGAGAATTNGDLVRYEQVPAMSQAQNGQYYTTGGTTTAYTLTPTPALTALAAGQRFNVVFNAANTTASTTLAISGQTAKTLKIYNAAGAKIDPPVGALAASMISDVIYDGTDYVVLDRLPPAISMVRVNSDNGFGSTNTAIRRFTNIVTNTGTDITYADSATLGGTFTINATGNYGISYSSGYGTAGTVYGVSLNSAQLTTAFGSITIADVLATATTAGVNYSGTAATTVYLTAGDVVRAHSQVSATAGGQVQFTITRVS